VNPDGTPVAPAPFNLLHHFYADLPRYAFTFQTCCFLSRIETVRRALEQLETEERHTTRPIVLVMERCWHSDRNTFALMLREGGRMNALEWTLYDQWYTFAVRNSPVVNSHVYLECSTDTCMSRLRRRDREEESGVSAEYQRALIDKHNTWLDTCPQECVLRVNVDRDFLGNPDRADRIVADLAEFVTLRFAAQGMLVDPEPYCTPSATASDDSAPAAEVDPIAA
jgi:deoxyadenosine/deoxycytidine kinase